MKNYVFSRLTILFLCLVCMSNTCRAEEWIDVTEKYLTNPSSVDNSNYGWTYNYRNGTSTVRCETMEFWNATFDVYQKLNLPTGKYG